MILDKDFAWSKYDELLSSLQQHGYEFRTFEEYCQGKREGRFVLLRHDVDARPWQSLRCAQLEEARRIRSSYYFRKTPKINCPEVIQEIIALNHEIGYHYEELSLTKGDSNRAIGIFEENLAYFRLFYPVQTICMHGSPTSLFDNRDLWKKYDYRRWGIIGEPYFDIDVKDMTYLTDTGRCWNGQKFNIRDKVEGAGSSQFHTTDDIIAAIRGGMLPDRMMITTHPQRWTDDKWKWWRELISQKLKNQAKRLIVWYSRRHG